MFIGCWKQIELKLSAEFKKLKESYRRGLRNFKGFLTFNLVILSHFKYAIVHGFLNCKNQETRICVARSTSQSDCSISLRSVFGTVEWATKYCDSFG